MTKLTGQLINLDTEQTQYLIDLLKQRIECENENFKHGLGHYMREGKPTVKQIYGSREGYRKYLFKWWGDEEVRT